MQIPYVPNPPGYPWCGPAALKMVLIYFGVARPDYPLDLMAEACESRWTGTLASDIASAAIASGLQAVFSEGMTVEAIAGWLVTGSPVIALIDPGLLYNVIGLPGHFVVVTSADSNTVVFHDPDVGEGITANCGILEAAWDARRRKAVRIWIE